MQVAKKNDDAVTIERPTLATLQVEINGAPPGLMMHRFGAKARKQIEDKQQKRASAAKEARDPDADVLESLYRLAEPAGGCEFGVPAHSFKNALVSAAIRYFDAFAKQSPMLRGSLFIHGVAGENVSDGLLVPILGEFVTDTREVKIGRGSGTDIRYRPHFPNWSATLTITADTSKVSVDQLVAFIERAGLSVGVCDARIEKCSLGFGGWTLGDIRKAAA